MIIEGRIIDKDHPPYVIAELSANHNGSLDNALRCIEAFKSCGADAIKLQTYTPDTLTLDCQREDFVIHGGLWDGQTLYQLYEKAYLPWEWHQPLFEHAKQLGITIFSTPFDETAVDLLEELNTPAYKIASFEAIDIPLIQYVAQTRKPMIISTGMASWEEIGEAVAAARDSGCRDLALLHCVSSYPAPIEQSNLLTIRELEKRFGVMAGISDHTLGTTVAIASIALGARIIEKHVTLDRSHDGPDSSFSLEPDEFRQLCIQTRDAWKALGAVKKGKVAAEDSSVKFRRSIYVTEDTKAGEILTRKNIRCIRPGFGLAPKHYESVLGRTLKIDAKKGTALSWDMMN
ncbi:MAG: pseudaminic acid synthase [Gammaproteobacteria bacterium]|nr:MAG: pseudaminic acid synthase [Gammaproteobacteria bacterium]